MMQKFNYVRSPELLKSCRRLPCQTCGRDDGTVVAAHSNQAKHGKGRSIKASDIFVASMCFSCHAEIDQGKKLSREERNLVWAMAHILTVRKLVRLDLWPELVELPLQLSLEFQ
jgi:ferredoxin